MKYVNNCLLTNHQKLSFLKELLQLTARKYRKILYKFLIKTHHEIVKTYLAVLFRDLSQPLGFVLPFATTSTLYFTVYLASKTNRFL